MCKGASELAAGCRRICSAVETWAGQLSCPAHALVASRRGGKGTCFAYGQTGSGKTYTMSPLPLRAAADMFAIMQQEMFANVSLHVRCGQLYSPCSCLQAQYHAPQLWKSTSKLIVSCAHLLHRSCYEIYGGTVYDLLNGRKKLDVREDGRKRVQVGKVVVSNMGRGCC